jgi:hypothetical protein
MLALDGGKDRSDDRGTEFARRQRAMRGKIVEGERELRLRGLLRACREGGKQGDADEKRC